MRDRLYRVRQFLCARRAAPLTNQEIERVRTVSSEDALALYQTMPPGDLRHALDIYDAPVSQGHTATSLLQAKQLHDVAKRDRGSGTAEGMARQSQGAG
jgi:hypothetical protein